MLYAQSRANSVPSFHPHPRRRHVYYTSVLSLIRELCRPATHAVLRLPCDDVASSGSGAGRSVADCVTGGLRSAANLYLTVRNAHGALALGVG